MAGVALALAAVTPGLAADQPRSNGELALILDKGLPCISKDGQPARVDLELDLVMRDGRWQRDLWGTQMTFDRRYAVRDAYSKAEVEGRIVSMKREGNVEQLRVEIVLPRDTWGTPGGRGRYAIDLKRSGNAFSGTYEGTFDGREAKGNAAGTLVEPYGARIQGFQPPAPTEHPRLAFRKGDLPGLRRRAQAPEGRAILARLHRLLAGTIDNYNAGYHAAGYGLLYQLNGEPGDADKVRKIVEAMLFGKGYGGANPWKPFQERERHLRVPLAVGVALAFDLCYDAWPTGFRDRVASELKRKAQELIEGVGVGSSEEYNDNYPSNHVALAQGGGGLVAMSILGKKGPCPPKPADPLARVRSPIEAPADYKPGNGVPVVQLEPGRMPPEWLFAGPLKPESADKDFLSRIGGRRKAHPEEGTKVVGDNGEIAFARLDPKRGIYNSKYTGNLDSLDLLTPIGRNYHSTILYYTVIENDRPRSLQFLCEHDGTRAFLAGRELAHGRYLKLGKGRFPLLLQCAVGETQPWGKIWSTPRFAEVTEKGVAKAAARYRDDLADWQQGRKRWEASGHEDLAIRRLLMKAYWRVRRHKQLSTGDRGWYNEGGGYNRYASTGGGLPFEVAWPNVMGERFGGSQPGYGWYVPLWASRLLEWGGKPTYPHYGPGGDRWSSDIWRSGDFVLGFAMVPEEIKPACKFVFDRFWGLSGDKTFDIAQPHQAAYALAYYPFEVEAKSPESVLPKALIDREKGYVQFRNHWQGEGDFVCCIYGKSQPTGGAWSYADGASFRLFGMRTKWAKKGGSGKDGGQEFENVVRVPGTNGWLGGQVTYFAPRPGGGGVVSFDTSDIYLGRINEETPKDARIVGSRWVDLGIRGLRSFAVDYSGKSGAEALVAVADRITVDEGAKLPAGEPVWQMFCGAEAEATGNTFTLRAKNGAILQGVFVAPADPGLTLAGDKLTATGREFLVVMSVQKGDPPAVKVEGDGLEATATVGGQTVRFDRGRLRLGY